MAAFDLYGVTWDTANFTTDFALVSPVTVDGVSLPRWAALHYAGALAVEAANVTWSGLLADTETARAGAEAARAGAEVARAGAEAAQSAAEVWINAAAGATTDRRTYTATAGQDTFAAAYDVGPPPHVDVFLNGVHLSPGGDYAADTGTSIVLTSPASAGDTVVITGWGVFAVADMVRIADISDVVRTSDVADVLRDSDVGTTNGKIIQADATGLPAIDGSQLTSLSKSQVGLGNVPNEDATDPSNMDQAGATDGQVLTWDNGAGEWTPADPIASGWVELASWTHSTDVSEVEFTDLDRSYSSLMVQFDDLSHNNASDTSFSIAVSDDNGTTYTVGLVGGSNHGAGVSVDATYIFDGYAEKYSSLFYAVDYAALSSNLTAANTLSANLRHVFVRHDDGINALKVSLGADEIDAGTIRIFAR